MPDELNLSNVEPWSSSIRNNIKQIKSKRKKKSSVLTLEAKCYMPHNVICVLVYLTILSQPHSSYSIKWDDDHRQ
jgi:hypothetical protein